MKKKGLWRVFALILCAALLPASASAAVLGDRLGGYEAQMRPGVTLSRGSYWTGSDYRTENYVSCAPDCGVYPVAVSRETLCSSGSPAEAAALLEAEGLHVLAGVNGDYFNMTGLAPVGIVIRGGILRSSCDGVGAVGFDGNGGVLFGRPALDMELCVGGECVRIEALNKPRGAGIAVYTDDYAEKPLAVGEGVNVICTADEAFTASCTVSLTAEAVQETETLSVPAGKVVLSLSADADEGLRAFFGALTPETVFEICISCAEGWENVDSAVGSLYKLVTDGQVEPELEKTLSPRTAVGVRADGSLVLYTVDGRQSGYSVGATMEQTARRMKELGCVEAGALDGGGSTALAAVRPGESALSYVSQPSEGKARKVVNYIFLVCPDAPAGAAERLTLYPLEGLCRMKGASAALTVRASDRNGRACAVPDGTADAVRGGRGPVRDGVFTAKNAGSGSVSASCGSLRGASVPVTVAETPSELTVYGERYGKEVRSLTLEPGQEVDLTAEAKLNHVRLIADDLCFSWALSPEVGTVDETGHLTASAAGGDGVLTVSAGTRSVEIPIHVPRPVPFEDVAGGDWFYGAVKFVYENGLFSGTGENVFSPQESMSRAMLAAVLWRVSGTPEPDGEAPFADVPPEAWYASPVAWAAENGVVNGVSETEFSPDAPLTREQIAVMLYRYHTALRAGSAEAETGDLAAFPDGDAVSAWAAEAVGWAARTGIISGREDGSICPADSASRAEVAVMLMRYLSL